jgi:hypothetical protein
MAAFGSISLTAVSLDFLREVAVIVEDPQRARGLRAFFRLAASGRTD